jgi:hypothetical protein
MFQGLIVCIEYKCEKIQRRSPLLFLLFRVRERRSADGFCNTPSLNQGKMHTSRFQDFAIYFCDSNDNCLEVVTVRVAEFTAETLASKTINSRLA